MYRSGSRAPKVVAGTVTSRTTIASRGSAPRRQVDS